MIERVDEKEAKGKPDDRGDEWGSNVPSGTRLKSRTRELERGKTLFDREENDRRSLDGDDLFGRIRCRVLSAKSGKLTDFGKQTK